MRLRPRAVKRLEIVIEEQVGDHHLQLVGHEEATGAVRGQ